METYSIVNEFIEHRNELKSSKLLEPIVERFIKVHRGIIDNMVIDAETRIELNKIRKYPSGFGTLLQSLKNYNKHESVITMLNIAYKNEDMNDDDKCKLIIDSLYVDDFTKHYLPLTPREAMVYYHSNKQNKIDTYLNNLHHMYSKMRKEYFGIPMRGQSDIKLAIEFTTLSHDKMIKSCEDNTEEADAFLFIIRSYFKNTLENATYDLISELIL